MREECQEMFEEKFLLTKEDRHSDGGYFVPHINHAWAGWTKCWEAIHLERELLAETIWEGICHAAQGENL